MSESKLVSVIIPTLNRPELTQQSYLSVLNQTYTPIETLIIDNGSSGPNKQRMKSLNLDFMDCSIPGAGAARKFGLRVSNGEYVLFLDSDDQLEPTAISNLLEAMTEKCEGVYGLITNIIEGDIKLMHQDQVFLAPLSSNTLLRRSIFDRYCYFDDDNFSWPRWVIRAEESGVILRGLDKLVTKRVIHGSNLSLDENSMEFYFNEILRKIRNRRED
jgi:glycosyltransferase involved in cell wall biosynthesis